jgi:hypothetical protein
MPASVSSRGQSWLVHALRRASNRLSASKKTMAADLSEALASARQK